MSRNAVYTTAITLTVAAGTVCVCFVWYHRKSYPPSPRQNDPSTTKTTAYESLIGSTPCIELKQLSRLLGRRIMCKMESWNPGGTGKDRAALRMIQEAERQGLLPSPSSNKQKDDKSTPLCHTRTPLSSLSSDTNSNRDWDLLQAALSTSTTGGIVIEGTSGSTGIALATISRLHGHGCLVVVPDDQAVEKQNTLRTLGASVLVVRTVSISHPDHYVNVARRCAATARQYGIAAVCCDQFETLHNAAVHYETTGPEIWRQCRPDAFIMSAGTGGTLAGVARYLKEQSSTRHTTRVVLVDPVGSVLAAKVEYGVAFTSQQQERSLRRHRYDSVAEGIGLDRVTANFSQAIPFIDEAHTIADQDAVDMAHWILANEGLLIGCSTAMNLVGAVQVAMQLPPKSVVCTIVCDAGHRHVTRFWNRAFLEEHSGLTWPDQSGALPQCISCELSNAS